MRRTLTVTGSFALTAVIVLTGCSTGGDKATVSGTTGRSPGPVTPASPLALAKKMLDDTAGVHLKLTSDKVPATENGLLSGEGDGSHAPAFKGTIGVRIAVAGDVTVPIVAVDGLVWAKTPLNRKMTKVDPQQFGAPDPAQIFARDGGFSSLLVATRSPKFGDKARDGKDVVQTVSGTLPGALIKRTLGFGQAGRAYDAVYLITEKGELRWAKLTGEFYQGADDTSYTVEFTEYGEKVAVGKP